MNTPNELVPEERDAFDRLRSRFGERFRFRIKAGRVVSVDLFQSQIDRFPVEITAFCHLTGLSLSGNQLTAVPPEIGRLAALTRLDLRNNQLTAVPPEIGRLAALTRLDLSGNQLTAVPPEIGNLTALTGLSLSGNQLTAVPPEIGRLTALTTLSLYGNLLGDPYRELVSQGAPAVLAYLRSLIDPREVVSLREARLILVGNGKVGKTQLKNALLGLPFEENYGTTHGVEIDRTKRLTLPCTSGGALDLAIWDFGGQETYEVTHQFFYGKRSIYLLVWHPRASPPDLGVEAWLRKLQLRLGDQARVIIVATHRLTDERPPDLDLAGLKQKFGDIVLGFYQVDNKHRDRPDNGIPQLKEAIAAAANNLSQIGMKVNRRWLDARNELSALSETRTHIRRAEFDAVAGKHGLTPDVASVWLNLLHDLGDLLYYGDVEGLKDVVVLRPDWLTGAIARVLDDAEVLAKRGVLEHARLPDLWRDYDPALHPFLHAVMEQFDICCREEGKDFSLVGEKVPHARPADIPPPTQNRLQLVYEFPDEPPGLIPWLIVRSYRFTTGKHWRQGMYLRHQGHGALVEFDRGSRRLRLEAHGPVPVKFFSLLEDGVEQVLPRWRGLVDRVSRLVPCGQTRKDGKPCDRYLDLKDLVDAAANGEELQCHGCRKMADPAKLLAGIGARREPLIDQIGGLLDEKLEPLRQHFEHQFRVLIRALTHESRNAPRAFSMWPKDVRDQSWWERLDPRKLGTHTYEVWLWCEHIEQPHPAKRYEMPIAAKWVRKVAPYARLVATALKVGLPVFGAGLGLYLDQIGASEDDKKDIADRIDKMSQLAEKTLDGELEAGRERERLRDGFSAAEGAALREFHALLKEIDQKSEWGGLELTPTKEGDHLWLCPEHHRIFDPGLIRIPGTSP